MMKNFSFAAAALCAVLLSAAAGCSAPAAPRRTGGELAGTLWKPVDSPSRVYVEFTSDDRVVGCSGVNRFFGPVSYAKGKRLRLGPLAATRMGGQFLKYEENFFAQMEDTRGYVLEDDKLTLYNEARKPVMVLLPLRRLAGK